MDFYKSLVGESIPLAEAAEFFIQVKTAGWQDPPDETGELEGKFPVPVEQVLALMKQQAECELRCMVACHIYGASVRGDGAKDLASELNSMSYRHRDNAEYLMQRMATLAGPVHIDNVEPPPASSTAQDIVARMIRAQQECLAGWNQLCEATCGNPMEAKCKSTAGWVQDGLDHLWKLVPHTVSSQILGPPAEGGEPPVGMGGELPPGMEHDEAAESPEDEANEPPEVQAAEDAAGIEMHPPPEKKPATKKEEPKSEKSPPKELDKAAMAMRLKLATLKLADEPAESAEMTSPSDTGVATNYLNAELMGQQAQNANESSFYQQRLQQAMSENQQMQQQIAATQEQLQSLQMQTSEAGAQIQQATDQAVQAQEEALQQTLLAAKMRMGMQDLRAQMLQVASQEPAAVAEEKQRQEAQAQAQALQQGLVDPTQAGPEAASAEAAAGSAAPDASGEAPPTASATGDSPMMQTAEPQAGIKAAGAILNAAKQRLPYALGGAALGAGGAAYAINRGSGGLLDKVEQIESMPSSYRQALQLARAKADLATSQAAEKYPGAATAAGALSGAVAGAVAGPKIVDQAKQIPPKIKELLSRGG